MICEHCKQRNATVTVTQVQSGQKVEHHYCDVCASQFHPFHAEFKQEPVSIQQLLSNWFGSPTWQKVGKNNRYNHNSKHAHNVDFRISNF